MNKVKATFGEVSMSNSNYTGYCFMNWGKVAAMGLSSQDFMNLREDSEFNNILDVLEEHASSMSEAQVRLFLHPQLLIMIQTHQRDKWLPN